MRRFVIAPDSFKGTMSAAEVCNIIANVITKHVPDADIVKIPMSDGGEGMVDAYLNILGGEKKYKTVTGPNGRLVDCPYAVLPDNTVVMEMAGCAGLPLMQGNLDPMHATTFGVGELLKAVHDEGYSRILMGLGGSATNDCGVGMASALGYVFLDDAGLPLGAYACNIGKIRSIKVPETRLDLTITVACDVNNPLCGPNGASAIFGPQKGLEGSDIRALDDSIRNFAKLIKAEIGADVMDYPGAGAAGGLGAAMIAFCNAILKPGIEILLDAADIDNLLKETELVITGEGRIDGQSAAGKVPVGVGRRAKQAAVPCIAICGCIGEGADLVLNEGISAYYPTTDGTKSFEEIISSCHNDLALTAEHVLKRLL